MRKKGTNLTFGVRIKNKVKVWWIIAGIMLLIGSIGVGYAFMGLSS